MTLSLQIYNQVEQVTSSSILTPIESSLSDSSSKSDTADPQSPTAQKPAGQGSPLLSPALLARVDAIVQQCTGARASTKEMRSRLVIFFFAVIHC